MRHTPRPRPDLIPLSRTGDEALTFAPIPACGWARYWFPRADREVDELILVQVAHQGELTPGRLPAFEVRGLFVGSARAGTRLNGDRLRLLPLGRIEAALNRERFLATLLDRAAPAGTGSSMPPIETHHDPGGRSATRRWTRPPAPSNNSAPPTRLPHETGRRSDDFYRLLTDAYLWLIASGHGQPAKVIADDNAVPNPAAVFTWLKVARRRGLLRTPTTRSRDGA
jgi:hypothetical protein